VLALSTAHEVGLAVTAGAFIAFALASSFLFPRYRPNYPAGGLLAFVVVSLVFFFGMLTAVEVFGAEDSEAGGEHVAETGAAEPTTTEGTTTQEQETTTVTQTTSTAQTTTAAAAPEDVKVMESEFKIAMQSTLSAGKVAVEVKNDGKIPHDLAIKGGAKTKLIQPGGKAELSVTLKPGKYHFYCTVPGHEQAGMKIDVTVS
jgi:uncharacterized cupredoxin-like copper-binding protein